MYRVQSSKADSIKQRMILRLQGAVQGVGFRPFVYRLAVEMGLTGWVCNSPQGAIIELEGDKQILNRFLERLQSEKPRLSSIQKIDCTYHKARGSNDFKIRTSHQHGELSAFILPDIATCDKCLKDIFDPSNRRYLYPFTNCTDCGPRYSIMKSLPYDRHNTTMKAFVMCDRCREEYENPADRRFHAQPNACPQCGPRLELRDKSRRIVKTHLEALIAAADSIREGRILALKGLGGFQLIVDARNDPAVKLLRYRKNRPEKPFALMYPDLVSIESDCDISDKEKELLFSTASPIVLLKRKLKSRSIAESVAPNNSYLGAMLPYTPLHHILMCELGFPVVATSGNRSDETICIDENDAIDRLSSIADLFLVHNRPIARPVDDSVVRVIMDKPAILRRARGYAPIPISINDDVGELIAVGGQQKNTVAVAKNGQIFISQHIGDLDNKYTYDTFADTIKDLSKLYNIKTYKLICDGHPDYNSTHYALRSENPADKIQHHYAHALSCMAENKLEPPVLGVVWDGTGYGDDGTVWGGEFLAVSYTGFSRVAHLRTFKLPGGEKAIMEPWRTTVGILYEIFGEDMLGQDSILSGLIPSNVKTEVLKKILIGNINAPVTSSAGRLFDAVSALIGLCRISSFEGQAAMKLEYAIDGYNTDKRYNLKVNKERIPYIIDWQPMIAEILDDLDKKIERKIISAKFHNSLARSITEICGLVNIKKVVLSGGCFQNRYLTEKTIQRLRDSGLIPFWHNAVPANDGGLSLGQIYAARKRKEK